MRKWDRYCVKCFWNLEDTDVRCRHCGHDFVKLHIRITAIHKKDSHNFKDRKLWIGNQTQIAISTAHRFSTVYSSGRNPNGSGLVLAC